MTQPQRLLRDLDFLKTHYVENRASVADLFRPGHRPPAPAAITLQPSPFQPLGLTT